MEFLIRIVAFFMLQIIHQNQEVNPNGSVKGVLQCIRENLQVEFQMPYSVTPVYLTILKSLSVVTNY